MIIPSEKGQYFEIWDKVSIEKLQNEHHVCSGHEESIKNMFFCVESCLLFSAGQLINSMRMRCRAVVQALGSSREVASLGRPPDTEPWSYHWNQWTLMKSKIPVTISMKIYANQAPATYFLMPLLWLMWWTFCEIKWLRVLFLNAHTSLFVCSLFVCLQCTRLFESVLMFMLACLTTKETLGNSFINTETKLSDLPNLGHFAAFQVWPYPTFQSTAPPCKP